MNEVDFEIANVPLAARAWVVLGVGLLDCHIREVHVRIANVVGIHREARRREACKARARQVDSERIVACAHGVDAQIKLFATNQHGIADILLCDVLLCLWIFARLPARIVLPVADLAEFAEQEDTLAL